MASKPEHIKDFIDYVLNIDPQAKISNIGRVQIYTGILGFTRPCSKTEVCFPNTDQESLKVVSAKTAAAKFESFLLSNPAFDHGDAMALKNAKVDGLGNNTRDHRLGL